MALFKKKATKKPVKKTAKKGGSADAKTLLKKMQAKKDAGDCPFC